MLLDLGGQKATHTARILFTIYEILFIGKMFAGKMTNVAICTDGVFNCVLWFLNHAHRKLAAHKTKPNNTAIESNRNLIFDKN